MAKSRLSETLFVGRENSKYPKLLLLILYGGGLAKGGLAPQSVPLHEKKLIFSENILISTSALGNVIPEALADFDNKKLLPSVVIEGASRISKISIFSDKGGGERQTGRLPICRVSSESKHNSP